MTTPEEAREQERAALQEFAASIIEQQPDPRQVGDFMEGELLSETFQVTSPLSVYVDVIELLDRFDDDDAKLWEFLGKLKDLFA
jgi:hypothetical protein